MLLIINKGIKYTVLINDNSLLKGHIYPFTTSTNPNQHITVLYQLLLYILFYMLFYIYTFFFLFHVLLCAFIS